MKNKIVFVACILTFLFMLGGCTVEVQEVDIPKEELQEYIYELALKTGYEGAYAEWISSVKGETGADGKKVELSTTLTHIIWRYEGEAEWRELIAIEELHAEPGKSAYDIAVEYGCQPHCFVRCRLHIDHIFLNTERVEIVDYKFLNDRIVLDDGEHRYSDHDPFVVTVKIKDN